MWIGRLRLCSGSERTGSIAGGNGTSQRSWPTLWIVGLGRLVSRAARPSVFFRPRVRLLSMDEFATEVG